MRQKFECDNRYTSSTILFKWQAFTIDETNSLKFARSGTAYHTVIKMLSCSCRPFEIITCTIMLKSLSESYLNMENKNIMW